jgi:hypothetical protein
MPGVRIVELETKVGELVPELTSSLSRVGHVIATGATAQEAIARAEAARDTVRIVTERRGGGRRPEDAGQRTEDRGRGGKAEIQKAENRNNTTDAPPRRPTVRRPWPDFCFWIC